MIDINQVKVGTNFYTPTARWACVDVGKRSIVAVRLYEGETLRDATRGPYTVFMKYELRSECFMSLPEVIEAFGGDITERLATKRPKSRPEYFEFEFPGFGGDATYYFASVFMRTLRHDKIFQISAGSKIGGRKFDANLSIRRGGDHPGFELILEAFRWAISIESYDRRHRDSKTGLLY